MCSDPGHPAQGLSHYEKEPECSELPEAEVNSHYRLALEPSVNVCPSKEEGGRLTPRLLSQTKDPILSLPIKREVGLNT